MKSNTYKILPGKLIFSILFAFLFYNLFAEKTISVFNQKGSLMLDFALNDLRDVLGSKGIEIRD